VSNALLKSIAITMTNGSVMRREVIVWMIDMWLLWLSRLAGMHIDPGRREMEASNVSGVKAKNCSLPGILRTADRTKFC